jgi:HD-GYP domain-containing protein (c-di-GMP phosphodiesterase class II)
VVERRAVQASGSRLVSQNAHVAALWASEKFVEYCGVPLIVKGQVKGVLEVFCRTPRASFGDEWMNLLETFGMQAAIAIDNAQLFKNLERSNLELAVGNDETIKSWARALEAREREPQGHTARLAETAARLARLLNVGEDARLHLQRGTLLHDIGKVAVPEAILLKPGQLTEDEWAIVRQHPQFAHDLLTPIAYLQPARDIPYCHHEKWDGTGYPRGLQGEQIPLAARLFAVVDVYDALTRERPHRSAWTRGQAQTYLREQSCKHFDPQIVELFLREIVGK